MAKVIETVTANPIKCACCGSVYQWEEGDKVEVFEAVIGFDSKIMEKRLECPNCGYYNIIEFIKENE